MSTTSRLLTLTLASLLFCTAEARAQADRPAAGLRLGAQAHSDRGAKGLGPAAAFVFDAQVASGWRAQIEAGATAWGLDKEAARGATGLTLSQVTVGALKVDGDSTGRLYVGGGGGLYRFRFSGAGTGGTSRGIYGTAGLEHLGRRRAIGAELRMHMVDTPAGSPIVAQTLWHGGFFVTIKRLF